ncbi:hypothetical protein ASPSYDRAFT_32443 [Aspergillus sydowii CBS 593.65]|uniref:Apple domain-containing protein n=1 Tax=Aspergillus sydowii CBS 593.65 TaxID=1036612 RepID=A0A1L9TCW0_9EURO|nr:uncharacterized protein ASPSYDRAFT_32443 [Aspergillus sydowii CBS 593.65]OJJ57270.1 hypothetical protein ASPSYDRAFT_32443 [Aspergillus sydowii CBS 593.65]
MRFSGSAALALLFAPGYVLGAGFCDNIKSCLPTKFATDMGTFDCSVGDGQYNCKTVPGTVPPHLKPGASKGEDKGNQRRKGPGSSHPRCNGERWKGLCLKGCHASLLEIDGIEYERRCYQSMTGVTHRTVPGYSSPAQCLENECTGDDNCLGIEWAFNVANPPCWVATNAGPTYNPATRDYNTYHALVKKGEVA